MLSISQSPQKTITSRYRVSKNFTSIAQFLRCGLLVQYKWQLDSREEVALDVVDISIGPTRMATSYRLMWAYGNHFCVKNVKRNLTTIDCGVAATFEQECRSGPQDRNTIMAQVEYLGWVEEILELDYE